MDEPKKRVIDVTTPGEPSVTSRPVIPSSQPPVADPTLAPATPAPKKIAIADEPVAPVLPSMTGPTLVTPSPPPPVEASLPSQPKPVEPSVQPTPPPADDMQNIPRFGELQPKIDSHPLFSGAPDPAPKKPRHWLRRITWIVSAILVLLIAAYLLIDSGVVRGASHLPFHIFKQPVAATTTPTITPITTNPYAGWKTYTSKLGGFSFKYPSTWSFEGARGDRPEFLPEDQASVTPGSGTGLINGQEDILSMTSPGNSATSPGSSNAVTASFSIQADPQKLTNAPSGAFSTGAVSTSSNGLKVWQANSDPKFNLGCPTGPTFDLVSGQNFYYQLANKMYLSVEGTFCGGQKSITSYTYQQQISSQTWNDGLKIIQSIAFQ